jgi:hypothetical protein
MNNFLWWNITNIHCLNFLPHVLCLPKQQQLDYYKAFDLEELYNSQITWPQLQSIKIMLKIHLAAQLNMTGMPEPHPVPTEGN